MGATSYALTASGFVQTAHATGGRLAIDQPFRADLNLAALATAGRYPGR